MNRAWEPFFIAFDMGNTVGLFREKLWVDIQWYKAGNTSCTYRVVDASKG